MYNLILASFALCVLLITNTQGLLLFPDNGLTLGRCEENYDCSGDRACSFYRDGKVRPCAYINENVCLCVPQSFQECTSSTQCDIGERCVDTNLSVTVCVACTAAEFVPSFLPVDFRSESDCEWPDSIFKSDSKYFARPQLHLDLPSKPLRVAAPSPLLNPDATAAVSSEPIPSFLFSPPFASPVLNLDQFSSGSYDDGSALNNCVFDRDCQGIYACRSTLEPLIGCHTMPGMGCQCAYMDPTACTHRDQCLPGELCVNTFRPYLFDFGVCISEDFVKYDDLLNPAAQFFPPESDPFFTVSPKLDFSPFESPGEFVHGVDLIGRHRASSESNAASRDILHPNLDSSGAILFPTASLGPDVYSTPESSASKAPVIDPHPIGFTLDYCHSRFECAPGRLCIDVFSNDSPILYCFEHCFCVPEQLVSCNSSSECVIQEACVTTPGVERSYCVSWDAIADNPAFEIIPFEDGSKTPPSVPPPSPRQTLGPRYTPYTGSTEPRYIPPGYLSSTPTPELESGVGLTLSSCTRIEDCTSGYACVSLFNYWPCSFSNNGCYCIPNNGKKGSTCINDKQCPVGEICFPKRRIDIIPSYCISQQVADDNPRVLDRYLSVVVPRGIGERFNFSYGRDWDIPDTLPENSGTGSNLTGDYCGTSADCGENRLCLNPLSFGSLCYNNCSISFCYPRYFVECGYGKFCDKGEVCARVYGMYESKYSSIHYSPKVSRHVICLSPSTIERNGYNVIPQASPPPQKFFGIVVWEYAIPILKVKLEEDAKSKSSLSKQAEPESDGRMPIRVHVAESNKNTIPQTLSPNRQAFLNAFKTLALAL